MGSPFSRVLNLTMPKRKSSKNKNNDPNVLLSQPPSKIKSVDNLSKISNISRQSRNHTNIATGLGTGDIRRSPRDVSKVGRYSETRSQPYAFVYTHPHQYSNYNDLSTGVSEYASQFQYSESSSSSKSPTQTNTKVLVIEDVDNNMGSLKSKNVLTSKGESESVQLIEKISVNFQDMVELQEKIAKTETDQEKARKFVKAWRTGLSYPKTKKFKVLTDIPLAATSHCKTGIRSCTRCYRRHVKSRITRFSTDNLLLADLVHQSSLERFVEETEKFHATSSILIKEDLKQKQLFESVHHADSVVKVEKGGDKLPVTDDDLQLTIRFNVPPPVHIDYVPEKNLFQKDIKRLTDLALVSGKLSGQVRKAFSLAHTQTQKVKVFKKAKKPLFVHK